MNDVEDRIRNEVDPSMELSVDESAWPLVVLRVDAVQPRGVSLDRLMGVVVELLERDVPHVLVIDTRGISMPTDATGRDRIRSVMRDPRVRTLGARNKICDVVIARSVLFQAAMTAVHWLTPPPNPSRVFGSGAEAIAWVRERCEAVGVPFSVAMERALAEL